MNLCRSCGHDFASVKAFDAHRTGKHAYTHREGLLLNPSRDDGRRCLTPSEMRTAGWETNRWGRWVHPSALRNRPKRGSYSPSEPPQAIPPTATAPARSERE
jgi:hypothetical protein